MKRIGLIDVDGHAKKKMFGATVYPNLALCKIAAWHKSRGDEVVWYDPLFSGHCDTVYISKVFNFSPDIDFPIDEDEVIRGGTGYNVASRLPDCMDKIQPDYTIYPLLPKNTAYGFLTRGCPNRCPWCVVPAKEGPIRPYMDIDEICTPERNKAVLMDNNILAAGDYALEQLAKIIHKGYWVDFNQALDARLVNDDNARLLAQVKWIDRRIRFGCDTQKQITDCERAMEMINGYGFTGQYFLYTILNSDFSECYSRVHYWWERNQGERKKHHTSRIYPYAQPYRDTKVVNEPPMWQKDMARWVNKKMIFEKLDFADYSPRKGFTCKEYLNTLTK